jgi:hypothetical protein
LDATTLERQKRWLTRLKRSTVFVHADCRFALESLRPHLTEARNAEILQSIVAYL